MQAVKEKERKPGVSETVLREGKYLTFVLCGEEYGIEILKVREIIGIMNITPVPQTPGYMKGVINLRGKVIPVVDLRLKFGFQEVEHTKETCIIVVEVMNKLTGILVDTVSEVLDVRGQDLEPAPHLGDGINTEIFLGMAKIKNKVKILLDIDKILGTEEINMVESLMSIG
ncbi:MAG: chemotaxis protein CheW [Candidatus Brocadia sp.]|jgi:Chemotaxis signal transduction protein|uniref:Chemotaxis protein CheW n=1 Tax=Candidatus Brocadia fulgida TaxID=380242 RepID=A0A0M2UVB1_9BACT|nr:MAG: purine binding chemotaxis protein [Candidatus Brocadia fulgida]MCC6325122.1 purine-binding chemotaxis protein CheW [Candidatus Brocadia sp.]MCE7910472.1 purine-binding chemotaxis protein CheW [Candidatus Brocadia sp. AMX3]MBV6519461.1 Chemotaxis protein CheW [Candidatus Brocadia fulgida]MDG5995427.1 purine-binding chemotaxis protein CheW [Candidatus Brocadia sp.]